MKMVSSTPHSTLFFIAAVLLTAPYAAASDPGQPGSSSTSELRFPPDRHVEKNKGQWQILPSAVPALSDEQKILVANDFERSLAEIYTGLARQLAPASAQLQLSDEEKDSVIAAVRSAGDELAMLISRTLVRLNFSSPDIEKLTPHLKFFSRDDKAQIRKLLADRDVDLSDELLMSQPPAFVYAMASIYRRLGIYIDSGIDARRIANQITINFPVYYFNTVGDHSDARIDPKIHAFLTAAVLRDVTGKLYDGKVDAVHMVHFKTSMMYSLNGVDSNYPMYGLNDALEQRGDVLIYDANIQHRTKRLPERLKAAYMNSVEIHETMHSLHRARLQLCNQGNTAPQIKIAFYTTTLHDLDEAQAQVATLAVLAQAQAPSMNVILTLNQSLVPNERPTLLFDDFYKPIIEKTMARQRAGIKSDQLAAHQGNSDGDEKFLASTAHAQSMSGGSDAASPDVSAMSVETRSQILLTASDDDVLDVAHAALATIAKGEESFCK
jgi:hypothetical protein